MWVTIGIQDSLIKLAFIQKFRLKIIREDESFTVLIRNKVNEFFFHQLLSEQPRTILFIFREKYSLLMGSYSCAKKRPVLFNNKIIEGYKCYIEKLFRVILFRKLF